MNPIEFDIKAGVLTLDEIAEKHNVRISEVHKIFESIVQKLANSV